MRFAGVRFLTLPFSLKDSRKSTAGGELRLGMDSMYMEEYSHNEKISQEKNTFYMGTFYTKKYDFPLLFNVLEKKILWKFSLDHHSFPLVCICSVRP